MKLINLACNLPHTLKLQLTTHAGVAIYKTYVYITMPLLTLCLLEAEPKVGFTSVMLINAVDCRRTVLSNSVTLHIGLLYGMNYLCLSKGVCLNNNCR